jgi:hypothetical protein
VTSSVLCGWDWDNPPGRGPGALLLNEGGGSLSAGAGSRLEDGRPRARRAWAVRPFRLDTERMMTKNEETAVTFANDHFRDCDSDVVRLRLKDDRLLSIQCEVCYALLEFTSNDLDELLDISMALALNHGTRHAAVQ